MDLINALRSVWARFVSQFENPDDCPPHVWGRWSYTASDGQERRACLRCGKTQEREVVPLVGEDEGDDEPPDGDGGEPMPEETEPRNATGNVTRIRTGTDG